MLFTTPTILTLLSATLAVAAPTPDPILTKIVGGVKDHIAVVTGNNADYKKDCKKDWDNKWQNDNWQKNEKLFYFDAEYVVKATPDQVNSTAGEPDPGQPGARGLFKYGINITENTICYNITLSGVTGKFSSRAATATHIHEAKKGESGPPRIVFPDPQGPDDCRVSYGCLTGPFVTGLTNDATGKDHGDGFHVSQIVENPSGFCTDSHTAEYLSGAVRGQLHYEGVAFSNAG